jgi:hypothetical protein
MNRRKLLSLLGMSPVLLTGSRAAAETGHNGDPNSMVLHRPVELARLTRR